MSVQVHYRKNENLALLNTVNNAIRETVYKTAPDIFFYDRPRSWVIDNVLDGGKRGRVALAVGSGPIRIDLARGASQVQPLRPLSFGSRDGEEDGRPVADGKRAVHRMARPRPVG